MGHDTHIHEIYTMSEDEVNARFYHKTPGFYGFIKLCDILVSLYCS